MTRSGRPSLFFVAMTFAAIPSTMGAEPQLQALFPMGVGRAGNAELSLVGTGLEGSVDLFFSQAGLSARREAADRFAVAAGEDAPTRDGDVWVLTKTGLSNPRRFAVGALRQVVEREKNDGFDEAQEVPLPVVIDGVINPATDRDHFRFHLAAGAFLSLVFRSESLGGSVRPALTVFGPDGRELLHDSGGDAEPALELLAPEEGVYRVRIEDRAYRRDPSSVYRLALFDGPRLVAAFPQVLTRGRPQPVTLYGFRLPGGRPMPAGPGFVPGLLQLEVIIDAPTLGDPDGGGWTRGNAVMLDGFAYGHSGAHGRLRFSLVNEDVTCEADGPHTLREKAQPVTPGGVIAGRFLRPGEVDWYRFPAKKDQALWIEAVGERQGLSMDLDMAIYDAEGKLLQTFSDTPHPKGAPPQLPLDTLDPMGAWKAPADGEYSLVIRDLYGPRPSGIGGYQLSIGPPREEVRVVAIHPDEANPRGLSLVPGKGGELRLIAVRRGGHHAPITVRAEGPPEGLEVKTATIADDQGSAPLSLVAAKEARGWVGRLALVAETRVEGEERSFPVFGVVRVRDGKPPLVRLCDGIAAAITDPSRPTSTP